MNHYKQAAVVSRVQAHLKHNGEDRRSSSNKGIKGPFCYPEVDCISLTNAAIDKDQSPAKGGEADLSLFYCGNHKFMQTNKQTNKETVFSQRQMTAVFAFQGRQRFSAVNLQLTQIKREISCDVISLPVETSQDGFNPASSCARVSPEPLFSGLR